MAKQPGAEVDEEQEEVVEEEESPETPEPEEPVKPKANELKVVIITNDDKVMLGVQSPDCDPVYTTLEGGLPAALKRVPSLVKEAKKKWEANPLNPKANLPEPEPRPTPARTPAAPKKETAQPSFF